jgi:hypothetical protein
MFLAITGRLLPNKRGANISLMVHCAAECEKKSINEELKQASAALTANQWFGFRGRFWRKRIDLHW